MSNAASSAPAGQRYHVVDTFLPGMSVSHPCWATLMETTKHDRIGDARSSARGRDMMTGSWDRFQIIDMKRAIKVTK